MYLEDQIVLFNNSFVTYNRYIYPIDELHKNCEVYNKNEHKFILVIILFSKIKSSISLQARL